MRAALLLAIATCAFVGAIFTPNDSAEGEAGGEAGSESRRERVAALAEERAREESLNAWSSGETVLQRAGDGHFYADVDVNGSSVNFLVDTGASMVALSAADASAAGLNWSDADIQLVGQGASGPVYGVPITIERMVLGGHEARDVEGAIITDGLQVSLLGQSFLSTIQPVRIEDDAMTLGE